MITITIPGNPIAKKRPRFARRVKFVTTYSDQQTEEGTALLMIREQWQDPPLEGPLAVKMAFYMPRPSSHYGSGKNAGKLKYGAPAWHIKKPDVDNMEKFISDVCNGLIWRDDSQIVASMTQKQYDSNPRTEIQIERIEK